MLSIVSRCLLGSGMAMTLLSPALAAGTCLTQSGPVQEGEMAVDACMSSSVLVCPAHGPVFQCTNGQWYCLYKSNDPPHQPCGDDKAGPWIWSSSNGLQRAR
jgi:hypothetical protein